MKTKEKESAKEVTLDDVLGIISINESQQIPYSKEILHEDFTINQSELDIAAKFYNTIISNPELLDSIIAEAEEKNGGEVNVYDAVAKESIRITKSLTKYLEKAK
jgi:hypothetical protein